MWHTKPIIALALCLVVSSVLAQEEKWDELSKQVVKLYQQGKYAEATKAAQKALEMAEEAFGPTSTTVR